MVPVGVPDIVPVELFRVRPAGRDGDTLKDVGLAPENDVLLTTVLLILVVF